MRSLYQRKPYQCRFPSPPQVPIGPPGQPTKFSFTVDVTGALTLKWQCKNPRQSPAPIFGIWRAIGHNGKLEYLETAQERMYVDDSVPKGTSHIVYQIQAVRGGVEGKPARFYVNFGTDGQIPQPFGTKSARQTKAA